MADAASPAAVPGGPAARPKLDDLMLSMDVVDTLRHQEALVARELDEDKREAELVERLRKIYRDQGIEVSDRIIQEGVKALKESRFVYTPPKPGLGTTLARLYVSRGRYGKVAGGVVAVLVAAWLAHGALVRWPAERAAEATRVELTQTLPKALDAGLAEVRAESRVEKATATAMQLAADGRAAAARGDAAGARKALADLEELRARLRQEFDLRIVSRPGEQTGVFRNPPRNRSAQNYYIIVEAIGRDGKAIPQAITSEEDGSVKTVTKWGVRVPQAVYESVGRDKQDDGIVQRNKLGEKRRGQLDVDYAMPVQGGLIYQW